jgi:hypothetical protein
MQPGGSFGTLAVLRLSLALTLSLRNAAGDRNAATLPLGTKTRLLLVQKDGRNHATNMDDI